jgi:hypothetical protein
VGHWHPWRALRERPHIIFAREPLPAACGGAVIAWAAESTLIVVDDALGLDERRVALAHELVHDERGSMPAGADAVMIAREERRVEDEVARRLAPVEDLALLAFEADAAGAGWTAADVAERLGVTPEVVERAVRLLDGC